MNLKSLAKFWASTARFVDFGVFTQKVQSWSKLKNFFGGNFIFGSPYHNLKKSMEQQVFAFSLIIEGTTEKVLPLKSIYNINFGFIEQKMYF